MHCRYKYSRRQRWRYYQGCGKKCTSFTYIYTVYVYVSIYVHIHDGHKHTRSLEWQYCQGRAKYGEESQVWYTSTYIRLLLKYISAVVYDIYNTTYMDVCDYRVYIFLNCFLIQIFFLYTRHVCM